jgi:hypothetical protein
MAILYGGDLFESVGCTVMWTLKFTIRCSFIGTLQLDAVLLEVCAFVRWRSDLLLGMVGREGAGSSIDTATTNTSNATVGPRTAA